MIFNINDFIDHIIITTFMESLIISTYISINKFRGHLITTKIDESDNRYNIYFIVKSTK